MVQIFQQTPDQGQLLAQQIAQGFGGGLSQGISVGLQQMLDQKAQEQKTAQLMSALGLSVPSNRMESVSAEIPQASVPARSSLGNLSPENIAALALIDPSLGTAFSNIFQGQQKAFEKEREFEFKRAAPILEKADKDRETLPIRQNAIKQIKSAVIEGDLSGLTKDYLAEVTGFEPFRSPEAAMFKTAGKEFFLGNIGRAGARPNQWVEQQIADMMPKIGRSKEANLSVAEALQFETDMNAKRLEILDQLEDQFKKTLGYIPGSIGKEADKLLKPYVEERQKVLAYDLRRIKEQANPGILTSIKKVPSGTPLTVEKAKFLIQRFGDKAEEMAKKLGYDIPSSEIYSRNQ